MLVVNRGRAFLAVMTASALLTACFYVSGADYDESWAKQVKMKSGACPVIDGTYENAGERFYKAEGGALKRDARSFAHLLQGGYDMEPRQGGIGLGQTSADPDEDLHRTIRLQHANDRLQIVAFLADGSMQTLSLPAGNRCRNSTLPLESYRDPNSGTAIVISMTSRERISLGLAEDGSLLAYQTSRGGALILWYPVLGYSNTEVTRFPPADLQPETN